MQIRTFLRESLINYSGKISTVVFTPGCDYRCPACHAKHLLEEGDNVDEKYFFDYLDSRKNWLEAVVICGGEPTLQGGLVDFAIKIKDRGLAIKLDTNGSDYITLKEIKEWNIIDYVAMDVKGPSRLYPNLIGKELIDARDGYQKSIAIVSQFPDYEFRTTIVPVIRQNGEINFLTPEEIGETAKLIYDCTGDKQHKYFLQQFVPHEGELVDSRLENSPQTPRSLMLEMQKEAIKYLPRCELR